MQSWPTNGDKPKPSWFARLLHETWFKAAVALGSLVIVTFVTWAAVLARDWVGNIVHAEELEGFVAMVIEGLEPRLRAIESQVEATKAATAKNAADLTRSRIQNIDAAMRDLRDEISDMEKDKAGNPSTWSRNDESLLLEWNRDLADLLCERVTLLQPNDQHVECL